MMAAHQHAASPPEPAPRQLPWSAGDTPDMLSPQAAWRSLRRRTGGKVALSTFYRWVGNGKIYSVRLGYQIFIPRSALEHFIQQCLEGERF